MPPERVSRFKRKGELRRLKITASAGSWECAAVDARECPLKPFMERPAVGQHLAVPDLFQIGNELLQGRQIWLGNEYPVVSVHRGFNPTMEYLK